MCCLQSCHGAAWAAALLPCLPPLQQQLPLQEAAQQQQQPRLMTCRLACGLTRQ